MTNEMVPSGEMLPVGDFDQRDLDKQSQRNFLPYVILVGKTTALNDKVKMGNYALITGKETHEDLTSSFEALVVGRRPRACRKGATGMVSVFDTKDAEYKKIVAEADAKKMGSWYGNEFLIWVRTLERWASFHAGSPTARGNSVDLTNIWKAWNDAINAAAAAKAAGNEVPAVANPQAIFKSSQATGQGQKYWAPFFFPATTPFSKTPTWAETREQLERFVKPPKDKKEAVEAGSVEDRG